MPPVTVDDALGASVTTVGSLTLRVPRGIIKVPGPMFAAAGVPSKTRVTAVCEGWPGACGASTTVAACGAAAEGPAASAGAEVDATTVAACGATAAGGAAAAGAAVADAVLLPMPKTLLKFLNSTSTADSSSLLMRSTAAGSKFAATASLAIRSTLFCIWNRTLSNNWFNRALEVGSDWAE